MLVRIPTDSGPVFFSPVSDIPVGLLPWDCTDLYAIPYDGKSGAPVKVPDFKAADNKTVRETEASLDVTGSLSGKSIETYRGVSAERWRRRLRGEEADDRKATLHDHLRVHMPGVQVTSFDIVNLEDDSKELQIKTEWTAQGFATSAGNRLLVNPNLFSRMSATDWAPAKRQYQIDLGSNYEDAETVTIKLPVGATDVTLPSPSAMNAGPVGLFETSYQRGDGKVVASRHMRLEMHRFPVESYTGLKRWFADIAASDDKPVVISMK